ncbi:MAG: hypothetical protein ABJL67_23925 [Sulfitobacter sp.]
MVSKVCFDPSLIGFGHRIARRDCSARHAAGYLEGRPDASAASLTVDPAHLPKTKEKATSKGAHYAQHD